MNSSVDQGTQLHRNMIPFLERVLEMDCSRPGRQGIQQQGRAGEARVVGKSYYNVKYVAFVAHS
jgi:hypothetical protein